MGKLEGRFKLSKNVCRVSAETQSSTTLPSHGNTDMEQFNIICDQSLNVNKSQKVFLIDQKK